MTFLASAALGGAIVGGAIADGVPEVAAVRAGDHVGCTAVLIAPDRLVTAAHCAGEGLAVGFARIADLRDARWIAVRAAVRHPRFDPATHARDLAVLVLAAPAPAWVVPMTFGSGDAQGPHTAMGFGHADPAGLDPHVRRAGEVAVLGSGVDELLLGPSPAAPCHGDSGGAVIAEEGAGSRLIALVAAGDPQCASHARAVRLDAHADFLAAVEAATVPGAVAAGGLCLDDASCAGGACVPADDRSGDVCAPAAASAGCDAAGGAGSGALLVLLVAGFSGLGRRGPRLP